MGYVFPVDKLPYVNFDGPVNYEDLAWFQDVMNKELLQRLQFVMGSYRTAGAQYGVVDETAPSSVTSGDVSRSLQPHTSSAGNLTIVVNPGYAVTPNGMIIYIEQAVDNIQLLSTDASCVHVVYLEWGLQGQDLAQDDYGTTAYKYWTVNDDADVVKIALINDFNSLSTAARMNIVPLAVVTVSHDDCSVTSDSLVFDYGTDTYSWNRPWFSAVDQQHRSELGTGPSTVPHSLSLNDLGATGDLTILDLELPHGVVVSKDDSNATVPGSVCEEAISTIVLDTDGSVTGIPGAEYCELTKFPVRLGLCWDDNDGQVHPNHAAFPGALLPDTNIVVFPHYPLASGAGLLTVAYSRAYALEPQLTSVDSSKLTVLGAADNEAIVAGGKAFSEITSLELDMRDAEPMPCYFKAFARPDDNDSSKVTMFTSPHVLLTQTKLTDIVVAGGSQSLASDPIGPAYVRVGLVRGYDGASTPAAFEVKFKVTGLDEGGNSISEWFKFDNRYVKPGTCSDSPEPASFLIGKTLFSSEITVSDITTDASVSTSAALIVYCDYHQFVSPFLDSAVPVANMLWNGSRIAQLYDKRPVHQFLKKGSRNTSISEAAFSSQLAADSLWQDRAVNPQRTKGLVFGLAEDLNDSRYSDLVTSDYFRMDDGLDFWSLPNAPITETEDPATDPDEPIILSSTVGVAYNASYFVWVSRAVNVMDFHPTTFATLHDIDTIMAKMFHEAPKVGWLWDANTLQIGNTPLWIRLCWIDGGATTTWTSWEPMIPALNHYEFSKALSAGESIISFQLAVPMIEPGILSSVDVIRRFLRTTGVVAYATHQMEVI